MAVGLGTTTLANKWLDTLSNTSYASGTATLYAKLHTGDPGAAGTANASQHTTRASVSFAAASGGSKASSGTPSWSISGLTAPTTETISHISLWDNVSAGNFLWSIAVTASKSVTNGDTLNLTSLSLALTPLAA